MNNIHEITEKFDRLLTEQRKTLVLQDRLINLAEQLKQELELRNSRRIG